ncbi:MAG: PAS domain-containing protein [bacterium]|nr:PAS domain-containing protein [bacterium]
MDTPTKNSGQPPSIIGTATLEQLWSESWTYIKSVVDIAREPILILDKNLSVLAANEAFYRTFQTEPKDTEAKNVYELGNGQWNIPALKKLLEEILPKNTFFKGFEVEHTFPAIGYKVMLLNGRQIHFTEKTAREIFPTTILLAMEDITELMLVADKLTGHTSDLESKLIGHTKNLEQQIKDLETQVRNIKTSA